MRKLLLLAIISIGLLMYPLSLFSSTSLNPDFDGSGTVDFPDFLRFVSAFGSRQGEEKYEIKYDLDSNGEIAFDDFLIFVSRFGKSVKPHAAKRVVSTSDVTAVCDRTVQVRDAIVEAISGVSACGDVTAEHLAAIVTLDLYSKDIKALKAGDFSGLTALKSLYLHGNHLSTLDADIFSGLTALKALYLHRNRLSTLNAGIFSNLTALETLYLNRNQLSALNAGIFSGLTALKALYLHRNAVDPLPITLSLESVAEGQFKARVHTGAPFNMALPIRVANGTIGEENSIEISTGSVTSDTLTVSRTPGTTAAVPSLLTIGELPALPSDHAGYALVKSADLPIEAIAALPTFSETTPTRSFAENTAAGENIGNPITATDPDGSTLTYSLEGTDADSFTIVSTSGQLQTKADVTYNYEVKISYSVTVKVVDGQGGSATVDVTITLTDVDEPPAKPAAPTVVTIDGSSERALTVSVDSACEYRSCDHRLRCAVSRRQQRFIH